jgi:3-oxoacyl-[acyl-carrier-protein] synthase II
MAFPKTVINSPAGHTAIKFGLTGLNATLSTGAASSLHALSFAADAIDAGRADVILAGGVEELCLPSYLGFSRLKLLSGSRQGLERAAPFDVNRNGLVLGEGAVILVLESLEHARARGANVYGEMRGFGTAHDAYHSHRYNVEGDGAIQSMRLALEDAGLTPTEVDYLCAGANGSRTGDEMEALAIKNVFGEHSSGVSISSIKSMVGECLGASGALQVAASLMALNAGTIPPTINFTQSEPTWSLDGLSHHVRERSVRTALVNAFGCDGNNASLLLGRCESL